MYIYRYIYYIHKTSRLRWAPDLFITHIMVSPVLPFDFDLIFPLFFPFIPPFYVIFWWWVANDVSFQRLHLLSLVFRASFHGARPRLAFIFIITDKPQLLNIFNYG